MGHIIHLQKRQGCVIRVCSSISGVHNTIQPIMSEKYSQNGCDSKMCSIPHSMTVSGLGYEETMKS